MTLGAISYKFYSRLKALVSALCIVVHVTANYGKPLQRCAASTSGGRAAVLFSLASDRTVVRVPAGKCTSMGSESAPTQIKSRLAAAF